MTFTDDDLKLLKEKWEISRQSDDAYFLIDRIEAQALLARLEAADKLLNLYVPRHHPAHRERLGKSIDPKHCFYCKAFHAWRTTSGK